VATLGFWTYQLVWSTPQSLLAVTSDPTPEAEQQRLAAIKEEAQRQAKAAAADAEAKLNAAEAEQQRLKEQLERQAKAASDADSKRKDAEAEQQRLKVEVQRQTTAAADADAKRRGAEAEQQRLSEELRKVRAEAATKQVALPQATSTVMLPSFESRPNMEGVDKMPAGSDRGSTVQACQEKCTQSSKCQAFTFNKTSKFCFWYDLMPTFRSNMNYDSGVRQSAALPANQPAPAATNRLFEIRRDMEAKPARLGLNFTSVFPTAVRSMDECEQKCTQSANCNAFTLHKTPLPNTAERQCFLYSDAELVPNSNFDSGVRK
jgi:hypothetical protein